MMPARSRNLGMAAPLPNSFEALFYCAVSRNL
jgi:hypothetical protein